MQNIYRLLFLAALTLYNYSAFAASQKLVTVTNDEDSDVIHMLLNLDENKDVKNFQMKTFTSSGKQINNQVFSTAKAYSGVVIYKKEKRDIVKLISKNFASHQGGDVTLDYLYNGITGSRGQFKFDLRRDGDQWSLYVNGRKATKLHFVSNKKSFVGTIGVKDIIVKK